MGLRSRIQKLKQQRGSIILELSEVDKNQIHLKRKIVQEIKNAQYERKCKVEQMNQQYELRTKTVEQIRELQNQRLNTERKIDGYSKPVNNYFPRNRSVEQGGNEREEVEENCMTIKPNNVSPRIRQAFLK